MGAVISTQFGDDVEPNGHGTASPDVEGVVTEARARARIGNAGRAAHLRRPAGRRRVPATRLQASLVRDCSSHRCFMVSFLLSGF